MACVDCSVRCNCVLTTAGDAVTKADYYTTVEEQQMFSKAFPEVVALFQQVTKGKEKRKHRKKGLVFAHVHDDKIISVFIQPDLQV